MNDFILHNYFRSTSSVRVRVALNLKGIGYEYRSLHLRKGEQRAPSFLQINPQGLVPALELPDGAVLTQSLAIIEYLDEVYPRPPLLPSDPLARARVRSLAMAIASDLHPLNNLRVLKYLKSPLGASAEAITEWPKHWVRQNLEPLEAILASSPETGVFCHGDAPSLADLCLFAQSFNNERFGVDMAPYPTIRRILEACRAMPEFASAAPEAQPDAE